MCNLAIEVSIQIQGDVTFLKKSNIFSYELIKNATDFASFMLGIPRDSSIRCIPSYQEVFNTTSETPDEFIEVLKALKYTEEEKTFVAPIITENKFSVILPVLFKGEIPEVYQFLISNFLSTYVEREVDGVLYHINECVLESHLDRKLMDMISSTNPVEKITISTGHNTTITQLHRTPASKDNLVNFAKFLIGALSKNKSPISTFIPLYIPEIKISDESQICVLNALNYTEQKETNSYLAPVLENNKYQLTLPVLFKKFIPKVYKFLTMTFGISYKKVEINETVFYFHECFIESCVFEEILNLLSVH